MRVCASHGELGWEDQRKVNYQCWDTPCHRFTHNYIVFVHVVHGSYWRESDLLYFVLVQTSTLLYIDDEPRISCVIRSPKNAKAMNKGCLVKCQERSHSIGHTGSYVKSLGRGQCPSTDRNIATRAIHQCVWPQRITDKCLARTTEQAKSCSKYPTPRALTQHSLALRTPWNAAIVTPKHF